MFLQLYIFCIILYIYVQYCLFFLHFTLQFHYINFNLAEDADIDDDGEDDNGDDDHVDDDENSIWKQETDHCTKNEINDICFYENLF